MERMPRPGEIYRQNQDKLCQVIAIAQYARTGEDLVVCQALYGEFPAFAVPLEEFMGKREGGGEETFAYAGVTGLFGRLFQADQAFQESQACQEGQAFQESQAFQEGQAGLPESALPEAGSLPGDEHDAPNPFLLKFLEAATYEEKLEILHQMRGKSGQREVDNICQALDLKSEAGTVEEQLSAIEACLQAQKKYDGHHLR